MSRLQQTQVVPDALVLSTVKVNGYNIDGNCQAWQPYQAPVSRTPPGIEQMGTPVKGACLPMTEEGLIEGAESIKGEKVRTDMDTNIDNVIKPVAGDVGQWKMGLHFGGGAQGMVSSVVHVDGVHQACLKVLSKTQVFRGVPEVVEDVFEVKYGAQIAIPQALSHPRVIAAGEVYRTAHAVLQVMPRINGRSMRNDYRATQYTSETAHQILKQLCLTLRYCQAFGVCHRDIKPENLMVSWPQDETRPKVYMIDWDLCSVVDEDGRLSGDCGTFGYMAPELWIDRTHKYDGFAADVFALGRTFIDMLGGITYICWDVKIEPDTIQGEILAGIKKMQWEGMLHVDPTQRLTIDQILSHPVLANVTVDTDGLIDVSVTLDRIGLSDGRHCVEFDPMVLAQMGKVRKEWTGMEVMNEVVRAGGDTHSLCETWYALLIDRQDNYDFIPLDTKFPSLVEQAPPIKKALPKVNWGTSKPVKVEPTPTPLMVEQPVRESTGIPTIPKQATTIPVQVEKVLTEPIEESADEWEDIGSDEGYNSLGDWETVGSLDERSSAEITEPDQLEEDIVGYDNSLEGWETVGTLDGGQESTVSTESALKEDKVIEEQKENPSLDLEEFVLSLAGAESTEQTIPSVLPEVEILEESGYLLCALAELAEGGMGGRLMADLCMEEWL